MSIKLYYAYRFPANKLNEFLDIVTEFSIKKTAAQVWHIIHTIKQERVDELVQQTGNPKMFEGLTPDEIRVEVVYYSLLTRLFKENADDWCRANIFNLQSGWSLFFHKGRFYAWPWGNLTEQFDEVLADYPWVENYSYWDNTDHPEDVSDREWERRGKTWLEIWTPDEFAHRLTFTTVDFSDDLHKSQFDIFNRLREMAKPKESRE